MPFRSSPAALVRRGQALRASWQYFARPRLLALGATPLDRARIAAVLGSGPLRRRIDASPRLVPIRLRLPGGEVTWHVSAHTDLLVVEQLFLAGEYDFQGIADPGVIVDLGAHVGASVLWLRRRFPQARIVAFEPDPINFHKLTLNVGRLPNVELVQLAVGDRDADQVAFASSGPYDGWGSNLGALRLPWQRPITVSQRRLDGLLAELGIDHVGLLKIDVEGAEYAILSSIDLDRVDAIVGELHRTAVSEECFARLLERFDYTAAPGSQAPFRAVSLRRRR